MTENDNSNNHWQLYKLLSDTLQSYHFRWINNYRIFLSFNAILLPATTAILGYTIKKNLNELYWYWFVFLLSFVGIFTNIFGIRLMNRIHTDTAIRFSQLRKIEDEISDLPFKPFNEGNDFFFKKKDIIDKKGYILLSQKQNTFNSRAINAYRWVSGSIIVVYFALLAPCLSKFPKEVFGTMDITTYQYLLSALIQVFGALIAGAAIFLIFQHDKLFEKKKIIVYNLGKIILQLTRNKKILKIQEASDAMWKIEKDAEEFRIKTHDEIKDSLSTTDEFIKKELVKLVDKKKNKESNAESNLVKFRYAEHQYNYYRNLYQKVINDLDNFSSFIIKMMGFPAVLCILFSLALFFADTFKCYRFISSIVSIIVSAIVFFMLIKWAKQILSE